MGISSFLYGLIRFQSAFRGMDIENENYQREKFEADVYENVRPIPSLKRNVDGSYFDETVQAAWLQWLDAQDQLDNSI